MKRKCDLRDEWAVPAMEAKPASGSIGRTGSMFHLILPLVCLVNGLSHLVGITHWVDAHNVPDTHFTFIYGAVFAGLGVFELRYWWRRLRGG